MFWGQLQPAKWCKGFVSFIEDPWVALSWQFHPYILNHDSAMFYPKLALFRCLNYTMHFTYELTTDNVIHVHVGAYRTVSVGNTDTQIQVDCTKFLN